MFDSMHTHTAWLAHKQAEARAAVGSDTAAGAGATEGGVEVGDDNENTDADVEEGEVRRRTPHLALGETSKMSPLYPSNSRLRHLNTDGRR